MAKVTLASWYKGQAPGTSVDVPDDEVQGLRLDGRIAGEMSEKAPRRGSQSPAGEAPAESPAKRTGKSE